MPDPSSSRSAGLEPLQIHHRLIIRHPSQPAILVLRDAGGLRLPAFASDDRHTAEVDYINLAVRERFGLLTTVLRSLRHSDPLGEVWFGSTSWRRTATRRRCPPERIGAGETSWPRGPAVRTRK